MKHKEEKFETYTMNNLKKSPRRGLFYYDLVVKFPYRFLTSCLF